MKYAFFLGCLIPARELSYEVSVGKVMPELGVELVDIVLKRNPELRNQVNQLLSDVGKEFKGKITVKNLVDVLYGDVGVSKVKNAIKEPFDGLKVGAQPGCHLTKPKRIHFELLRGFNDLDSLVQATGVESVPYERKEMCCGGPLRDINDDLSRQVSIQKLRALKEAEVQAVVTVCPFCFLQLDLGQLEIKRHSNEEFNLPVIHFIELLRMGMGMKLEDWEIKAHRIPITELLKDRL